MTVNTIERFGREARRSVSALVGALICGTALASSLQLPPVGGSSHERHPGKIIWADLVTPDLAVAESFYSGMFGWTFQTIHTGDVEYAVARAPDGDVIAGLLKKAAPTDTEHRQSAWLTFIAVRDVDAAERTALANGATSVSKPKTYAGRGRQAVLADPDGAVFAILASSTGDPADTLSPPGEWIWSSLMAKDPERESTFYQTMFRYDLYDLPREDGAPHVILSSDDFARASVNPLPAVGHRRPHWLNFIRVASADDAAAKAVALGGKVLVQPHEDRHGGKLAVVADPAGAPVGIMEWTAGDSKVEPQ